MIKTKHRDIRTKIPHPDDLKLIRKLQKLEPKSATSHQLPVVWDFAVDYNVWDRHGNRFIDFSSCIFVANAGHSNPEVCTAIRKQVNRPLLHTYTFPTEIRHDYLKALTSFTGFEKAFLVSAGTEATEAACKIMREAKFKKDKHQGIIVSIYGSMHGKTALAEQLKNNIDSWAGSNAMVFNLPYPDPETKFGLPFEPDIIAGFIIESYRGWDAKFLPRTYVQDLVKFAKENGIPVCFDEIQAGWGRTGKLFAYEHYDIPKPDLVCCGKGISGGVALAAVLGSRKLIDTPDDLSSTNSGNPVACAAGLANIRYFEEHKLVKEAERKGKYKLSMMDKFIEQPIVKGTSYAGLVGAVIFKDTKTADKVAIRCLQKGIIVVRTGRESIKLGPPLTIKDDALLEGLQAIEEAIKEVQKCK